MHPKMDVEGITSRETYSEDEDGIVTIPKYNEKGDAKARHILGLDTMALSSDRPPSASSASTNKLRSTGFSDATTAAVSVGSPVESHKSHFLFPLLQRKGSSVLQKRSRKATTDVPPPSLGTQPSNTSLRSFYDRSRAPLQVSQQTSDSSSRDFALRKGTGSVISANSQEKEHSKQIRLFSRMSSKRHSERPKLELLSGMLSREQSLRSVPSSIRELPSERSESVASASTIAVARSKAEKRASKVPVLPVQPPNPYAQQKAKRDPSHAKINVRRPKVGAKNWFDSIDSESDGENEVGGFIEPIIETDVAVLPRARVSPMVADFPPRTSSKKHSPIAQRHKACQPELQLKPLERQASKNSMNTSTQATVPKPTKFDQIDLRCQSVLSLTSDSESDDELQSPRLYEGPAYCGIRESLMNGPLNPSVEYGQALVVSTKDSEQLLQALKDEALDEALASPSIPRRVSSRFMTYLDDQSTGTLTPRKSDVLNAFPTTPSEVSRAASLRDSVQSEHESIVSTKLMTVTRQEERLIAAMRLKKSAMKRSQTARKTPVPRMREIDEYDTVEALPQRYVEHDVAVQEGTHHRTSKGSKSSRRSSYRPESAATTFQTESMTDGSIRSSILTATTEASADGMMRSPRSSVRKSRSFQNALPISSRQYPRESFLSEATVSTMTDDRSLWSRSDTTGNRGSHIVMLDTLDRQMLRDEIPSQLFMERPFIGWEARAHLGTAH